MGIKKNLNNNTSKPNLNKTSSITNLNLSDLKKKSFLERLTVVKLKNIAKDTIFL